MEFMIEHVEVYGLDKSLIASGNPMRTEIADNRLNATESDEKRGIMLAATPAGAGHDNWLNGVIVQMDVYAPLYWWKQAQRYHWFNFISSQSTMHRAMVFPIDDQCIPEVDIRIIKVLEEIREEYQEATDPLVKNLLWRRFIANIPSGFVLGATMTTNYRQLKTMYLQRQNHRLKEWRKFCEFCEQLPLFLSMIAKMDEEE